MMRQPRIEGYDLIRTLAIVVVFIGHSFRDSLHWLSPGLTMSLLGFLSAILLVGRQEPADVYLTKRLTRIYLSLFLCLGTILIVHGLMGKHIATQHTLLHLLGLSAFIDLAGATNDSTIGLGLWFITVIVVLYLLLPILESLLRHRNGLAHCVMIVLVCLGLELTMYGTGAMWDVVMAFTVGVYCGISGWTTRLQEGRLSLTWSLIGCVVLLVLAELATEKVLPYAVRSLLFPFYPLAFVPVLCAMARYLPNPVTMASGVFAGFSYEFYILHGHTLSSLDEFVVPALPPIGRMLAAFTITCLMAAALAPLGHGCDEGLRSTFSRR